MSDEIKMKFKIGDTVGMEFHLGGSVQPSPHQAVPSTASLIADALPESSVIIGNIENINSIFNSGGIQ